MSRPTLGINLTTLAIERQLSVSSSKQASAAERLSSGQRINRASDDAAGLSISSSLSLQSRVFTRGVKNINDGISAINIAESAVNSLTTVSIRQLELAQQAASGSISLQQRKSLQLEVDALTDEFNRIVQSASFNGQTLLSGDALSGVVIQIGFGSQGTQRIEFGSGLASSVFNGSFNNLGTGPALGTPLVTQSADLNNDGFDDLVYASAATVAYRLGVGDGTFGAVTTLSGVNTSVAIGDFNGDGYLDLFAGSGGDLFINNGDATFTRRDFDFGSGERGAAMADVNGDGRLDLISLNNNGTLGEISVGLQNSSGAIPGYITTGPLGSASPAGGDSLATGDFNGDGKIDIIFTIGTGTVAAFGNGDGTFTDIQTISTSTLDNIQTLDFNRDGVLDFVAHTASGIEFYQGVGDGSFTLAQSFSRTTNDIDIVDFNNDGITDVVAFDGATDTASVFLGNLEGSFAQSSTFSVVTTNSRITFGDFNNDGAIDVVANNTTQLGKTTLSAETGYIVVTSEEYARSAIDVLTDRLANLSSGVGALGAARARLEIANNALAGTIDNYAAAEGRIRDSDIAQEAGELLRAKILTQVSAALLGQAGNSAPLVLDLLR